MFQYARRRSDVFPVRVATFVVLGMIAAIVSFSIFLAYSTRAIDAHAVAQETRIATHVIGEFRSAIAHEQESVTVWDDAVSYVRAPKSEERDEWIDVNLGSWMTTYFGHDAAFVLNSQDEPIYASVGGAVDELSAFDLVRAASEPMAVKLRDKLRAGDTEGLGDRILSLGITDYSFVGGRPAIVSLKPIVSDSGEIEQVPGEEYLHVAVRYLDSGFLTELAHEYGFNGLRFSSVDDKDVATTGLPLIKANGEVLGYFIWEPYRPGLVFVQSITPALLAIVAAIAVLTIAFAVVLYRRLLLNRAQEERIRYLADHDALTGLLNRASFERHLDHTLADARGANSQLAVLYLDLDRFKQINDTMGHSAGDMVIRGVAERIEKLIPANACFCRVGGDEFNIYMPYSDFSEIEAFCNEALATVNQPFSIGSENAFVGISIGAATFPAHGTDRSELVRKADVALYNAKASGRGCYAVFGPHMDALVRERAEIERDLREALADTNQFSVVYQPKYIAKTGDISSVEALVRWQHPIRGTLSPLFFIPIAEEAGLIKSLGRHVLHQACKAAVNWPIGSVAVNVSPIQWHDPLFAMEVITILEATGLNPRRLELEITETAWTEDSLHCSTNIRALREIGVSIALDDFGVGFSSLGRLRETEVDHVKIDRVFVEGLGKSQGDEAIVQAIVDLARAKGLMTTAEGVQTKEQSDFLKQIGCDELQGFLFSEPVAGEAIDELLGVGAQTSETHLKQA